jgi:hypothetical protein
MRRKSFDTLISSAALVLAAVLLSASGLLLWAHTFVSDNVRTQLSSEKIFFPAKGSEALNDPAIKPYLSQYAGQQLVNGKQAKAYADHFIAVHLKGISGGKTYSELSAQSIASPNDTVLAGKVATVFKGETLRGLLLNAYAFATMGTIAGIAAVVSFAAAGLLLVLAALGFWHLRRTPRDAEVLPKLGAGTPAPVEAI